MSPDFDIKQYMDVNYYGCVHTTIAALPHLQKTNGMIAVVSSLGSLMPFPRQTLYNASKYALIGFYDSLRMELQAKNSGVGISMICPGFVKTGLTRGGGLGRDGKPIGVSLEKASPIPMISASDCATDIMHAIEGRKKLVVTPSWYLPAYYLHKMFPSTVQSLLNKVFAPPSKKKMNKKKEE
jgi:short-subunit dehydrogenase